MSDDLGPKKIQTVDLATMALGPTTDDDLGPKKLQTVDLATMALGPTTDDLTCDFISEDLDLPPIHVPVMDQYGTVYDSPRDAARTLGLSCSEIKMVLAGRAVSTKGYRFQFAST